MAVPLRGGGTAPAGPRGAPQGALRLCFPIGRHGALGLHGAAGRASPRAGVDPREILETVVEELHLHHAAKQAAAAAARAAARP
ncbi:MAG: hypothetical protein UZ22_OP11002000860, partial [Microgenomates bacterium OLB23]